MTAAKEIVVDAAVAAVPSGLDGALALKEEQRTALSGFLGGRDVFASIPAGFGRS